MSGIRLVTKSDCPFCSMAKNWLKEHAFDYKEDLIDNEEDRLAFYQTINGAAEPLNGDTAAIDHRGLGAVD